MSDPLNRFPVTNPLENLSPKITSLEGKAGELEGLTEELEKYASPTLWLNSKDSSEETKQALNKMRDDFMEFSLEKTLTQVIACDEALGSGIERLPKDIVDVTMQERITKIMTTRRDCNARITKALEGLEERRSA
jgi:hypothetical protein